MSAFIKAYLTPRNVLILLLLTALATWLARSLEPYEKTVNTGFEREAVQNSYLAAERFLQSTGMSTARRLSVGSVIEDWSTNDTLLLLGNGAIYEADKADTVLDWVDNGGHLIYAANVAWDEQSGKSGDALLDRLGVRVAEISIDELEDNGTTSDGIHFRFPGDDEDTHINFDGYTSYLVYDRYENYRGYAKYNSIPDFEIMAQSRYDDRLLIRLPYGRGFITLSTITYLWDNYRINQADNAWLLWSLINSTHVSKADTLNKGKASSQKTSAEKAKKVWVVFSAEVDSIFYILWKKAAYFIVSSLIVLALWLWMRAARLGPIKPNSQAIRRELMEQLEASTAMAWRQGDIEHTLNVLRARIQRRLISHHGLSPNATAEEQCALIEKLNDGLREATHYQKLLFELPIKAKRRELEFIKTVHDLQQLQLRL